MNKDPWITMDKMEDKMFDELICLREKLRLSIIDAANNEVEANELREENATLRKAGLIFLAAHEAYWDRPSGFALENLFGRYKEFDEILRRAEVKP